MDNDVKGYIISGGCRKNEEVAAALLISLHGVNDEEPYQYNIFTKI